MGLVRSGFPEIIVQLFEKKAA
ncbi:MAG: hypothetical protein H6R01_1466, partial [Burkholderiaceae bacterium]|nr:hypothetical protein [Burkholderiaceae bacterium]